MSEFCFKNFSLPLGKKTYIMGILNVTPDSFSDGGKNYNKKDAIAAALKMAEAGADIIDIGAQSTRPGHVPVSPKEEYRRLEGVLERVIKLTGLPVSVDTYYPEVAGFALEAGCHIINDISGVVNLKTAELVKKHDAGWILMHNGEEQTENIAKTVHDRLCDMLEKAVDFGIKSDHICLDPGIGFGKTMQQNAALIMNTGIVRVKNIAYLLGASRKRIIGAALDPAILPQDRDWGTVAAHTIGILGRADILRVHNCEAAVQAARVADYLMRNS